MNHLFKALFALPLLILTSCETNPKLSAELDKLRLDINTKINSTSYSDKWASAIKTISENSFHSILRNTETNYQSSIRPDGVIRTAKTVRTRFTTTTEFNNQKVYESLSDNIEQMIYDIDLKTLPEFGGPRLFDSSTLNEKVTTRKISGALTAEKAEYHGYELQLGGFSSPRVICHKVITYCLINKSHRRVALG